MAASALGRARLDAACQPLPEGGGLRVVLRLLRLASFDIDADEAFGRARVAQLDLSMNRLDSLGAVPRAKSLRRLDLGRNLLSTFPAALDLPELEFLSLANNALTSAGMPRLGGMPRLAELSLAYNRLERLPVFDGAGRLATLRAEGNCLTELVGLAALPALRHLYVQRNRLGSLDGAALAPGLETLHAAGNELAGLGELARVLAAMPALSTLHLRDNPVAEGGAHRAVVLDLPALKCLDAHEVKSHFRTVVREQSQERTVDELIEAVTNEYAQRLGAEKVRRDQMLARLDEQKRLVEGHYAKYKRTMEADLEEVVRHLQEVRSGGRVARDALTRPESIELWRAGLAALEKERVAAAAAAEEEAAHLRRGAGLSLSAKMYRISLARPDLWRRIKAREQELRAAAAEDALAAMEADAEGGGGGGGGGRVGEPGAAAAANEAEAQRVLLARLTSGR